MPIGQSEVTIDVLPYADGITEANEVVAVGIAAGAYAIGSSSQASVTISDQMMVVKIEAVDTLAVKETQVPATFLVSRRDVIDRDVLIRLQISGTAANGVDYNTVGTSLLLPRGQSMALILVTPKATANLAGGMETVRMAVRADAAYLLEPGASSAQVSIIERQDTFQTWLTREFPDAGDLEPSDTLGSAHPADPAVCVRLGSRSAGSGGIAPVGCMGGRFGGALVPQAVGRAEYRLQGLRGS